MEEVSERIQTLLLRFEKEQFRVGWVE